MNRRKSRLVLSLVAAALVQAALSTSAWAASSPNLAPGNEWLPMWLVRLIGVII